MGLKNFMKRGSQDEKSQQNSSSNSTVSTLAPPGMEMNEKTPFTPQPTSHNGTPHRTPGVSGHSTPAFGSRRNSFSGSMRSQQSYWMEDIKHEVMVNYLFQQQCSALWVGDGSGQVEGVLLRKSRGYYMSCPPQLIESPFGHAIAQMNCQVSSVLLTFSFASI